MIRWYCLLLFFVVTFTSGFAQLTDLKAWFDLQRDEAGQAVITGMTKSQSSKSLAYSYSMRLSKIGPSGNAINTQSGSFTLLPEEQKLLSVVTINLGATASFEVILKIFDDEGVVAEKKLISDQQFITSFKKLSPKPKIQTPENISSTTSPPKEIRKSNTTNTDALEIDGLVIDETRSKSGRDFYDQFYSKWTAPKNVSDFTIIIKELPARGRGARISVEVNGNVIVRRMLQPRLDIIELLAEQSTQVVQKHLTDNEKLKNDLGKGGDRGNGIY